MELEARSCMRCRSSILSVVHDVLGLGLSPGRVYLRVLRTAGFPEFGSSRRLLLDV